MLHNQYHRANCMHNIMCMSMIDHRILFRVIVDYYFFGRQEKLPFSDILLPK